MQRFMICLILLFLSNVLSSQQTQILIPKGELIEKVSCRSDASNSYALYLPSNYSIDKRWPILYCLDAGGRGKLATELFREGAEKYGYIVAGSNDTRSDDPTWSNWQVIEAMWHDTRSRFSIDEKRTYAAGFSGGARLAWGLGYIFPESVAGVIGCGGGAHPDRPPSKDTRFIFFGTAGNKDFNYLEMRNLDLTLARLGIPHRVAIFDGGHEWAPQDLCTQALEWMEIRAMKNGRREKDSTLLDSIYTRLIEKASTLEETDKTYDAWEAYHFIVEDFQGLLDTSKAAEKASALASLEEVKNNRKAKEKRDAREAEFQRKLATIIGLLRTPGCIPPRFDEVVQKLEIRNLKETAAKRNESEDGLSAQRMLEAVFVQTSFYLTTEFFKRKDYVRAVLSLSLAAEIKNDNPVVWYNLACAYSLNGDKKKAVETLGRAVQNGFTDLQKIQNDPDLDPIRQEEEYGAIIEEL